MSRPDTQDFASLFLRDTPMMDTRAPLEFKKGAFPHTVSLPLMTDAERAKVGTCYKQKGQDEAIKLGHQLVGRQGKRRAAGAVAGLPVSTRTAICIVSAAVCAARLCSNG